MKILGFCAICLTLFGLLISLPVTAGPGNPLTRIAEINKLKDLAKDLVKQEKYVEAAQVYERLIQEYELNEGSLLINRANLYYLAGKQPEARVAYQETVLLASESQIRSRAYNQLGLLSVAVSENPEQAYPEALELFKEALKENYKNNAARKNYEITYRLVNPTPPAQEPKPEPEADENQPNEQPESVKPSEFAKQQKARADQLVSEGQYNQAYELMTQALERDQTVKAYQSYISRLGDIANIVD